MTAAVLTIHFSQRVAWTIPLREVADARDIVAECAEAEGLTHLWYSINGVEHEFNVEDRNGMA